MRTANQNAKNALSGNRASGLSTHVNKGGCTVCSREYEPRHDHYHGGIKDVGHRLNEQRSMIDKYL